MKKKNEVIKDEKYFEKKLGVHSKKKFVVGICSATVLIGGLTASTCYFALRGGTTDKDNFLRAFDRINKGNYTMKGKISPFLSTSKNEGEIAYDSVDLKINDKGEELCVETSEQDETVTETSYVVLGKDNKLYNVEKAEHNGKYYTGDQSKGRYSDNVKEMAYRLNDYEKFKKNGNVYTATYNTKDFNGNESTPDIDVTVSLTIEKQVCKKIDISGQVKYEGEEFSGTFMEFNFSDYDNTTIAFSDEVKNFKIVSTYLDTSMSVLDPTSEIPITVGDPLIKGEEYFAAITLLNEESYIYEPIPFDSDTTFILATDNIEPASKKQGDKYYRFKVKDDAIPGEDIEIQPNYCLNEMPAMTYTVGDKK